MCDSLLVIFFAKTAVTTVTTSVISTLNLLLKCFLIFFISRIVLSFSFSLLQKQRNKVVTSTIIIQKQQNEVVTFTVIIQSQLYEKVNCTINYLLN